MSTVIATSVLPDSTANDTLTIGATGDSVAISGDSLNLNTLQDAGGNAIFVSDGSGTITSAPNFSGAMKFISSQTASGSASLAFTSGIDSTYDVYIFKFLHIQPATDNVQFSFQMNASGGSGYDETMTTTYFQAYHDQANTTTSLEYSGSIDQSQGTAYQSMAVSLGNGSDECLDGELYLYGPSSTTYIKQFYARVQSYHTSDYTMDNYTGGYFNVTAALDEISFKMTSGNIAAGTIAMYGMSKT